MKVEEVYYYGRLYHIMNTGQLGQLGYFRTLVYILGVFNIVKYISCNMICVLFQVSSLSLIATYTLLKTHQTHSRGPVRNKHASSKSHLNLINLINVDFGDQNDIARTATTTTLSYDVHSSPCSNGAANIHFAAR
jgi:hypothetical protein